MTRPDGRKHRRDQAPAGPGGLTLTELLDTEQALNAMVERAEAVATVIVSAARDEAKRQEVAAAEALETRCRDLEVETTAQTARELADLTASATAEAARFDAVPDERVIALADAVVRDFFGIAPFRPRGAGT